MAHTTLVDVATLHDHLNDPGWLIIDCRHSLADHDLGRRQYNDAHIAGAFYADLERDLAGIKNGSNGRHPLPAPNGFAAFLRALGTNDETQIVAYDAGGDMFAARLWFLSRWIGHTAVAVLDGGLTAWTSAGLATTSELPRQRMNGNLNLAVQADLVIDTNAMSALLNNTAYSILDARAPERFAGDVEPLDPVAGHIPGAKNRLFKHNFEPDGHMKSPHVLRDTFAEFTTAPEHIVHQCGSGISAAVNMLAMEHAGMTGSRLYAGGWSEWCADPTRPMVTKPKPA